MRLLLDTRVFLWSVKNDRKLSKAIQSRILRATEVYVSSASIWELVIKIKLKKLDANIDRLLEPISESEFVELPITARHAAYVRYLPNIHHDPFDRILVARAICEPLTLLTADVALKDYSELVELINF